MIHQEAEKNYQDVLSVLAKGGHPSAGGLRAELRATALLTTRNIQRNDAHCVLKGKTVSVYNAKRELLAKLANCDVGEDITATVCFMLLERDRRGVILSSIEVTPNMKLYIEPHRA